MSLSSGVADTVTVFRSLAGADVPLLLQAPATSVVTMANAKTVVRLTATSTRGDRHGTDPHATGYSPWLAMRSLACRAERPTGGSTEGATRPTYRGWFDGGGWGSPRIAS